ncbi:AAA domain-containing protein [Nostoc sp. GT001]|uniref:AAA domain-containing protein n=1 Tax=Nostoc sp. GT001 TaxID=3056647 RepID=UPI0025AA99C7|nr:AAA domain-containing protein [Nostoc sp. GT001]MDM9581066.1 AAA domain-containing protein [Nostoc sp. GT001]
MSNGINPVIQQKINDWRDKLAGSSNSNPLLDFRKSKKPKIEVITPSLILFDNLAGYESESISFKELRTNQTEADLIKLLDKLGTEAKKTIKEKGFISLFLVLGTLTWFDTAKPQEKKEKDKLVSPLLLIPVELQKKGKKPPEYTLCSTDEDISINFLLVNKLRDEFNITLPETETLQNLGYEGFINAVRTAIGEKQDWELEETAYITLFDSIKTAMIKDLEQNQELIANHPVLQGLALQEAQENRSDIKTITDKKLDTINPELIYQICNADSSQQVVIEAAKARLSFVVQGPPGTGKSQTIANIIAELIGKNKTVLLVAEKETALDAVYKTLRDSEPSLEDLCLKLHHKGTTTKELVKELNQTKIRLSQRNETESEQGKRDIFFQQLHDCRQSLNSHTASLHHKHQPINKSAFELYGELLKLERELDTTLEFNTYNLKDWSEKRLLLEAKDLLNNLGQFEPFFRGRQRTIWSSSPIKRWNADVNRDLRQNINDLRQGIQLATITTTRLRQLLKIEPANTLLALDKLQPAIAHLIEVPPRFPKNWLRGTILNTLQQNFDELKDDIGELQHIGSDFSNKYINEFLSWDLPELTEFKQRFQNYKGIFRWLKCGYLRTRRSLISLQKVKNRVTDQELIKDIDNAIRQREIWNKLKDTTHQYHRAFGSFFEAQMPDLDAIEQALNWLKGLQSHSLPSKEASVVISSYENLQELRNLLTNLETSRNLIREGFELLTQHFHQEPMTKSGELERKSLYEVETFLNKAQQELVLFQQCLDCEQLVEKLENIGAKDFLLKLRESNIQPNFWFLVLQKGIYKDWLQYILDSTELRNFNQKRHEQKLEEFSQLDNEQYKVAIQRLRQLHAERWKKWSEQPEARTQIQLLEKQNTLKKGHKKIRQFIKEASKLVTTLKPFWLMSPLAVSQYIEPEAVEFDVVIFDEASQVCTEDAVPSIMRAKQVIVVGDNKQLPPTYFFKSNASGGEDEEQEIYDSLLDESSTFLDKIWLKWHYRSKHESLIAFSNQNFYDLELLTFPNPAKNPNLGVHFEYVPDGIYTPGDGGKYNIREAQKVAELTIEHCLEHCREHQDLSELSLGIITLNESQEEMIRDKLQQLSSDYPNIQEFCQEDSRNFFIKPLERVQGDQREIIIFSFGFGFYENSQKLIHKFGALTNPGGRRRLNVAITRAKSKFVLVASIKATDFDSENEEVRLIQKYFDFAEKGGEKLETHFDNNCSEYDFLFEEDVYQALTQQGYRVKKRVGRSAYPIDLTVIDERRQETEEFLLGIVCDGTIYHKYPTARERDRLRHEILKGLGWNIYRIWSSEWYWNRDSQIKLLVEHIKHLLNQE